MVIALMMTVSFKFGLLWHLRSYELDFNCFTHKCVNIFPSKQGTIETHLVHLALLIVSQSVFIYYSIGQVSCNTNETILCYVLLIAQVT